MWPIILHIGPLTIYSFGAMVAIACLTGSWLLEREMTRRGLPGELAVSMAIWATFIGFVTSSVWYYVQQHFWELLAHPLDTLLASVAALGDRFATADGNLLQRLGAMLGGLGSGFVWYGGLIGGTLTVTWFIYRYHLPWLVTVDCAAPALALAHAIGRVGCLLSGDGDWGTVTTVPWAMAYPDAIIGWPYPPGVRVHPTPIYEMIAYTGVFAILWSMRKRPHPDGTIFWWYLVLAGAARFVVEFFRINPPAGLGLSAAQWFSLLVIAIGGWRLWAARRSESVRVEPLVAPARR